MSKITRREFIRGTAGVTLAGAVGGWTGCREPKSTEENTPKSAPARARVVLVRDEKALDEGGRPQAAVLRRMLDEAVTAFTDESDPVAAWKGLVRPTDTVGIKSNVWRFLRTPEGLEEAIRGRLMDAGVSPERIGIDDRGVLGNPVFQAATALVNVRPMRTHHWSGVGSLIKNYIMFHPEPWTWHDDSCADLAGIWDLPVVRGKTRLNILVMLTPLFQSKGPHAFSRKFTWPYRGLLVGTDPVAVDAVGLRILEAKRREHFGRDEPFHVPPKHIRVAEEKFGLGVAEAARIDLLRLGWTENALV
jgi:hypothetical protein